VEVELLISHGNGAVELPVSLARFDFQQSQLRFESRSDGSKDIDLVSHEITVSDTRYQGRIYHNRRATKILSSTVIFTTLVEVKNQ